MTLGANGVLVLYTFLVDDGFREDRFRKKFTAEGGIGDERGISTE